MDTKDQIVANLTKIDYLICVVKAFMLPKLTYCLPIWGHLERGSPTAMDHTLLHMARVVLGNRAAVLDRDTYTATGILPIAELAAMKCILAVHSSPCAFTQQLIRPAHVG